MKFLRQIWTKCGKYRATYGKMRRKTCIIGMGPSLLVASIIVGGVDKLAAPFSPLTRENLIRVRVRVRVRVRDGIGFEAGIRMHTDTDRVRT